MHAGGLSSLFFFADLLESLALVVIPPISPKSRRLLYDKKAQVESARLYGDVGSYQYYFVDLEVGDPAQRVSVILDTGSSHVGFPCASCSSCGHKHIDQNFNISLSATGKWDRCDEHWCTRCEGQWCTYSQSYAESSSLSGYWFRDLMRLGDSFQENPALMMHMGCHYVETNLFVTQKANGIMGVQAGSPVLKTLFADKEHVNHAVFAICLSHEGGRFDVGGYDESVLDDASKPLEWIKLGQPLKFYLIKIGAAEVNGVAIPGTFGRTIIDSGTTFTYFPDATYKHFISALTEYMKSNSIPHTGSNACLQNDADVPKLPDIKFTFPDGANNKAVVMLWKAKDYMVKESGKSHTCAAFDSNNGDASTVLGATFMKHKNFVFDVERGMVAMPPAKCPTYVTRPDQRQPVDAKEKPPDTLKPGPISSPVQLTFFHILVGVSIVAVFFSLIRCLRRRSSTQDMTLQSNTDSELVAIGNVPTDEDEFVVPMGDASLYEIESDFEDDDFQRAMEM